MSSFEAHARYWSQNQLYCNPSGWARLVLLPQQRQRHVRLTQLAVNLAPLRQRALCFAQHRRREQPPLERRIIERLGQRPAQTLHLGAADVLPHRRRRHLQASRYRPGAQTRSVMQPQNLSYLTHGQPPVRHRECLPENRESPTANDCPASLSSGGQTPCTVPVRTEK